jgi:hypothetical protein
LLLLATDALDLLSDQVTEPFEIDETVGLGAHDKIAPYGSGCERIVDLKLKWSVETDHTLNDLVWRRIFVTSKCDTNAEPPSEWLSYICQFHFKTKKQI